MISPEGRPGPERTGRHSGGALCAIKKSVRDLLVLFDLAVADVDDAVSVHGDIVLVRDQYDGVALLVQALEQRHDFVAGRGIEVAGRLVRQQDRRIVHQRAGDGDALPLTAGKLVRLVMHALLQIDLPMAPLRRLEALVGRHAAIDQRQLDIVQRRGPRQQVERLEDEPDFLVADLGELVVLISLTRLPLMKYWPPWAYPGSRSGSSAWICPDPEDP